MIQEPANSSTDLDRYFRLFLRRKWLVITMFLTVMVLVQAITLLLPATYESSSTIAIEGQRIVNPLLKGLTLANDPRDRLNAVQQKMLSWTSVQRVLQSIGIGTVIRHDNDKNPLPALWRRLRLEHLSPEHPAARKDLPQERATAHIRRNTTLEARGKDLIVVSYRGPDSASNADIVNRLVANFIEDSIKAEREGARDAYKFIDDQLSLYEKRLEQSEKKLRVFKEQHIEQLPGSENINLTGLVSAKATLQATEMEAGELENELKFIDEQLTSLEKTVISEVKSEANPMMVVMKQRITDLEIALTNLRINYTDEHPRIKETVQQISDLKARLAEEEQSTVSSSTSSLNPIYQELLQKRHAAAVKYKTLRGRMETLKERIASYRDKVNRIPEQEQHMASLTRDSVMNESIYNMLLQRRAEARISHELSLLSENVEKFKIIEYARATAIPVSPDRVKILLMAVLLAAGTAGGLVLASDYFDQSFKDVDDAQQYLAIPMLATVPIIKTSRYVRKSKRSLILWSGVTALMATVLVVLNVHLFVGLL